MWTISADIQTLVEDDGFSDTQVKYLGGLYVLIKFKVPRDATTFLQNKETWMNWFKRLDRSENFDLRFERLIWLKITGLPVHAWCDKNFEKIASNYGKVISNENSFDSCLDLSFGKIGVLSAIRTKINEECMVYVDDGNFRIGITEVDENWSPFCFDTTNSDDSSDDEDDEGNDTVMSDGGDENIGISDTWIQDNDDTEEGEIKENKTDLGDQTNPSNSEDFSDGRSVPMADNHSLGIQVNLQCNNNEGSTQHGEDEEIRLANDSPVQPIDPARREPLIAESDGLPINNTLGFTPSKRRRTDPKNLRFNPYRRPIPLSNHRYDSTTSIPSIDLNRDLPQTSQTISDKNQHIGDIEASSSLSSYSKEIEHTINVAKHLGFDIEDGNEVFNAVMAGDGDCNLPK
ncbi:hypothetical protein L2E82_17353 [Cichorium intybus]|uniref:Uncharacterized protein n=1 Tax=Cichorium intybus TaxID=13427 RepID=A0ACB9F8Q9_CICIN|nr:hypothetical protein L2E82_17353 [Cichorium intybus]